MPRKKVTWITPQVTETVDVVKTLYYNSGLPVRQLEIAEVLGLDKGAISRRVNKAITFGLLTNLEPYAGRPHKLIPSPRKAS